MIIPRLDDLFYVGEHCFIDFDKAVYMKRGLPLALSRIELRLLKRLSMNPGSIVSHDDIIQYTWMTAVVEERHILHVYMNRLRNKLESNPKCPKFLITIKGMGYGIFPRT